MSTMLSNFAVPDIGLLIAGAFLGGLVQGIAGFAFGMVAMSVWAWSIHPAEAIVLVVSGGLCGQVLAALTIRRRARVSELLPFVLGGLAGVPIGVFLLPYISVTSFKLLLGAVLVIGCPLMMTARRVPLAGETGWAGDAAAGFAGGIIGGVSGLTAVAPVIWCAIRGFDKSRQRDLLQNFNLVILAATMLALIGKGTVTRSMVPHMGIVAIALVVPSILGARIYRGLSETTFRRVVLVLLTLSGVALLASGIAITAGAA